VAGCLAKSPDSRFQLVQMLQLELRMLATSARRGATAPAAASPLAEVARRLPPAPVQAPAPEPARTTPASERSLEALEARITARFQEQERAVAVVERMANEVLNALHAPQSNGGLAGGIERPARGPAFETGVSRMDRAFDLLSDKASRIDLILGTLVERVQRLEQNLDQLDTDSAALRDSVTRDIRNFERALKAQGSAIESARTAMGQTDDLVERVVEALDSLQSMFLTGAEERAAS
jgi:hypothetical protein